MAEEKVVKDNTKELQAQLDQMKKDLEKAYEIANAYIKAYRNLLGQLNLTVETQADINQALSEKLK